MTNKETNSKIGQITEQFTTAFSGLNKEQLNWKPNPETWSIAQNLDHLIVINESYFPIFDALKTGNYQPPFIAKIGFLVHLIGKMILNSVAPANKKKTRTFPIWEPTKSDIKADILDRFVTHQSILKNYITQLEPLAANDIVISSPANKNIVYKLNTAFDIILSHELRHFEQAQKLNQLRIKEN